VILFDEIEKAHPDVWNALLQILEDGRLTDGQGHVVDFRNTVIIMTSNVGTDFARRVSNLGFQARARDGAEPEASVFDLDVDETLKKTFRPEFLNRIDEIIVFRPLSREQVQRIVDLQMKEIGSRLADQGLDIELTPEAREWLANKGYDPQFGARPLRRTLQREVESVLARRLLAGDLRPGATITIEVEGDQLAFTQPARSDAELAESVV